MEETTKEKAASPARGEAAKHNNIASQYSAEINRERGRSFPPVNIFDGSAP